MIGISHIGLFDRLHALLLSLPSYSLIHNQFFWGLELVEMMTSSSAAVGAFDSKTTPGGSTIVNFYDQFQKILTLRKNMDIETLWRRIEDHYSDPRTAALVTLDLITREDKV